MDNNYYRRTAITFPISAGVYPREIDQSFLVPAAANSIGAIVVHSLQGSTSERKLITNAKQFLDEFGEPSPSDISMYSALAFLEKGKRLYVVRVINDAVTATLDIENVGDTTTIFTINAINPGLWGNSLTVDVGAADAITDFVITVYLSTVEVESFTVNRTVLSKDGFGKSTYIEDVINENSAYINVVDTTETGAHDGETATALAAGLDDTTAPTDAMINTAWDTFFKTKEDVEISLLINGGWATVSVHTNLITIAEFRKDCFAILDMAESDDTPTEMVTYVGTTLNKDTSYAAVYGAWVYIYDQFNDKYLYVPPSGYVAGVYANSADVSEVWYAPAGSRRGQLNVIGVKYIFTEGDRDTVYAARINPIQNFTGSGIQVYGQKTLQVSASALDRVNVRLLMISLEKSLERALRPFVFEFNDDFTRNNIKSIIDQFMGDIKTRRGVTDFLTVCDTTNNTAQVIDSNQLIVDLYVKPTRVAEFIRLNAIISPTGAVFSAS